MRIKSHSCLLSLQINMVRNNIVPLWFFVFDFFLLVKVMWRHLISYSIVRIGDEVCFANCLLGYLIPVNDVVVKWHDTQSYFTESPIHLFSSCQLRPSQFNSRYEKYEIACLVPQRKKFFPSLNLSRVSIKLLESSSLLVFCLWFFRYFASLCLLHISMWYVVFVLYGSIELFSCECLGKRSLTVLFSVFRIFGCVWRSRMYK